MGECAVVLRLQLVQGKQHIGRKTHAWRASGVDRELFQQIHKVGLPEKQRDLLSDPRKGGFDDFEVVVIGNHVVLL